MAWTLCILLEHGDRMSKMRANNKCKPRRRRIKNRTRLVRDRLSVMSTITILVERMWSVWRPQGAVVGEINVAEDLGVSIGDDGAREVLQ
jgi:hypothetical protein